MATFFGNTSSIATNNSYNIVSKIISYSVSNKGASNTIAVGIVYGSTIVEIFRKVLSANESFQYLGEPISIPADYSIVVTATDSTDYYFSIE